MNEIPMSKYYFEEEFKDYEDIIIKYSYLNKKYKKKEVISSQGETLVKAYYIKSGVVRLSLGHESGQEKTIAFFGPGMIFPLGISEHHYELEYAMVESALTDVEAYELNYTELRKIVTDNHEIALKMIEHYCDFTNFLFYEITSLSYDSSIKKISNILFIMADKVYKNDIIHMDQEDISEIAGLSKIQVIRVYKILKEQNIIETFRSYVEIKDKKKLLEYC